MTGCKTVRTRGSSLQLQFKCLGATGFKGISGSGSESMWGIGRISRLGRTDFHLDHFHVYFPDHFFFIHTVLGREDTLSSIDKYLLKGIKPLCHSNFWLCFLSRLQSIQWGCVNSNVSTKFLLALLKNLFQASQKPACHSLPCTARQ